MRTKKPKLSFDTAVSSAERFDPSPEAGLNAAQAEARRREGLINTDSSVHTKSYIRILSDNLLTLFNIINVILACAILWVGAYKNAAFIGVVVCNVIIGIVQEIRAKRVVDKLAFITQSKAHAVRDGDVTELPVDEIVLDDILILENGSQIAADCIVVTGECEVNESFVTGESDPVFKKRGDILLAGSFVVSGSCRARVDKVSDGCYISRISSGAKYIKKDVSQIIRGLKKIIKIISVIIVPAGALIFLKDYHFVGNIRDAVIGTAAALIGMIPQGLMLLTSSALALGIIKLSKKKVLVQDLYCIEMLARVDTLCLDKTGTITEGRMEVSDIITLREGFDIGKALASLIHATGDTNATASAIAEHCVENDFYASDSAVPFSSKNKWSAANFTHEGCFVMGAYEFLFVDGSGGIADKIAVYGKDYRIVVLAHSKEKATSDALPDGLIPVAIVLLRDRIRPNADKILEYFYSQGVDIKIISGDSPVTVSSIAKSVGVTNGDRYIDCSRLSDEDEIAEAAEKYTVFGRVTPEIKKALVLALKKRGRTVAMTGDGVNDVLALKESDCSIAMASGSDAARSVSNLVLLDSSFDPLPSVIDEGRRSVNNIQRSASLFLVKTIYSVLLSIIILAIPGMRYPFEPIQLTLIGFVSIGFPSFVLAFAPNKGRISGSFFENIIIKAFPGALVIVADLVLLMLLRRPMQLGHAEFSTLAVVITGFTAIIILYFICRPLTPVRIALIVTVSAVFGICVVFIRSFFSLVQLNGAQLLLLCALAAFSFTALYGLDRLAALLTRKLK